MKKKILVLVIGISILSTLIGCSNKLVTSTSSSEKAVVDINNKSTESSDVKDSDIFKVEASADWVYASKDIKSLYNDSELIIKATIDKVDYYCGTGGLIYTKFIPKVIETYKGTYDGSYIQSIGGIVDYSEYIKNDVDPNNFKKFTNSSNQTPKKVQLTFDDIYVVKQGEEYILFCKKNQGLLSITNGNQGLFKVDSNNVTNKALKNSKDLSADIEKKVNKNNKTKSLTNTDIASGIDKNSFINVLKDLKNLN